MISPCGKLHIGIGVYGETVFVGQRLCKKSAASFDIFAWRVATPAVLPYEIDINTRKTATRQTAATSIVDFLDCSGMKPLQMVLHFGKVPNATTGYGAR